MFPYHDENKTQRPPVVTVVVIGLNVLAWLVVQGAGQDLPLARSICNLGLIPGELTASVPPGVIEQEVGAVLSHVRTITDWSTGSQPGDLFLVLFRKG